MPLHVVILAAGQGKRMHSALPKVLHRIAGRPLLAHALDAARSLKPERIFVVYGHGGAAVKAAFEGAPVEWVEQARRLGTGHALLQALPRIPRAATVLVLNGDVPLVRSASFRRLPWKRQGKNSPKARARFPMRSHWRKQDRSLIPPKRHSLLPKRRAALGSALCAIPTP